MYYYPTMEIDYTQKLPVKKIKKRSVAGRFFQKIRVSEVLFHESTACWEWQQKLDKGGYGRFATDDDHYAHRAAYKLFVGQIPDDKEIDHRCRRRHCVNPLHLEAVPHKVNQARMAKAKDGCVNGHPFSNVNGRRVCKTCRYEAIKKWRERNPEKARQIGTESKRAWRQKQAKSDNIAK